MFNFNEALADYLRTFGDYVRGNGHEIEFRGVQAYLQNLARIVEEEDIEALQVELKDLKEQVAELWL